MIEFERRATGAVANPDVGSDVLFLDNDGVFYTKNSAGVLTVLGRGIASIVKTGTAGLVDTYTITFDGGDTQTYTVTNGDDGRSIVSIDRTAGTGAPGTTDTYTITYSEAPLTSTFTVYNGANGLDGSGQPAQNVPTIIDPDDASSIGTRTAFYALEDHQHAIVAASAVGLNGESANGEGTASSFARSDHTHAIANGGTPSTIQPDASANQGASTSLARSDHTHAIAADVPVALGASASEGTSNSFARADHVHVNPVIAHEAAGDPHPQYTTDAEATTIAQGRVTAHEQAADPHPQYLTQAEGDVLYQAAGQSAGPAMASSVLAATQANTTVTAADINGQVFTIPPGKTARIQGNLIFTAAATTTGAFYGFRVSHGAGANGNVQGSWNAEVSLTSAAAATGLADGDSINVAGGATVASGILGTASVAGNNSAWIMLTVVNRSTNANATVALQFRSEVANSAVTAQIGTSAVALIG